MGAVTFYLPAASVELLRKVPGFVFVDLTKKVLHCDLPGAGLTDAPRAFSIKLGQTTSRCGLIPSKTDLGVCMRHDQGRLACVITKHPDDIKVAGLLEVTEETLKTLENNFGKLKISHTDFCELWSATPTRPKDI